MLPQLTFQYPQSDRALCNISTFNQLSTAEISFSIPNRIEPSATEGWAAGGGRRPALSVSPIGSSPLQHGNSATLYVEDLDFQYPQSDRALCNLPLTLTKLALAPKLSVSPIGSSPLQQHRSVRGGAHARSFSIPNRIEPSATEEPRGGVSSLPLFQYPQSDRALCNLVQVYHKAAASSLSVSPIGSSPLQPARCRRSPIQNLFFQYPQSDRALCNGPPPSPEARQRHFQYPQSDRALCNRRNSPPGCTAPKLSVSPIGSSPLQLLELPLVQEREWQLSVSPIGSSPLQHPTAIYCNPVIHLFQYPQSDRALCNKR